MGIIIFIIGICLGSFYLVLGKRLPKNENVINDRSRCDSCSHTLSWWELIPLLSFIYLKGKCHYCHKKISILNPLVELIMGIAFLLSYRYYGIGYDMFLFDIIFSLMIIIFISDFSYYIILDSPLVLSIILIIIIDIYYKGFSFLMSHIVSGLGLFLSMYVIKIIGDLLFKRESLGGGDIKFAFVIGLVLGYRLGLVALILSTFLALPYSFAFMMIKKNNEVPYGPFLAASLFIVTIFLVKFQNLLDLIFMTI